MNKRIITRWTVILALACTALAIVLLAVSGAATLQARSLSTDYTVGDVCGATIQACINNPIVQAGDRILIPAGTYTESVTLNKPVGLIGADADITIIHAIANQRVMTVTGNMITATTVISGLTFTGGRSAESGGGLWLANGASSSIQNVIIRNNYAATEGGGIYIDLGETLSLSDAEVSNNVSGVAGGGIYVSRTAILVNDQFVGNQVINGNGGGLYAGGILTISGAIFLSNTAEYDGGGLRVNGPASIFGSRFENNRAGSTIGSGGGVEALGALHIAETVFMSNTAMEVGGAIFVPYLPGQPSENGSLVNLLFVYNKAGGGGTALSLAHGNFTILHSSIIDSNASWGAGITVFDAVVNIVNTIITGHYIGLQQGGTGVVQADYNLFFNNTIDKDGAIAGGGHDVFGNPDFVDPAKDDYHILPPSAAINAGVDAGVLTDLDGNPRPANGGFDIGAYEYSAPISITELSASNSSPTELGNFTFFTATANGAAITYYWDFGDNTASGIGATTTHQYAALGSYTATVTATNGISTVVATTPVTIVVLPIVNLNVQNSSPTELGNLTFFTATANGTGIIYHWNFGDGTAGGSGAAITHQYTVIGSYIATVTATNSISIVVATTPVTITARPITGLSVNNSSPTELGSLTFFTATADGTAITYDWDFGDGTTGGSGATTTHQYTAMGAYTATVTATNSISTVVATTPVTITARPIAGLSASNSSPTAIGKPTTLTATIESGDLVTYTWNFGDGSVLVTGQVVTHTYPFAAPFSFTATVTATNPINTQTATTLVTIVPKRLYLPLLLKSN